MVPAPKKQNETGLFKKVWQEYNRLIDYSRSIAVMPSGNRGVTVHRTANGTLLRADASKPEKAPEPSVVTRYVVMQIQNDYVNCWELNNDGTAKEVRDDDQNPIYTKIAKPFNLRRTGWDGLTIDYYSDETVNALSGIKIHYVYRSPIMREARIGGPQSQDIEIQVVRPSFILSKSVIFATKVENKTGVSSVTEDLVDINADARAWAAIV